MKKNIRISTLLNCILVVIFLAYSYSWMVTEPSYGEIVDYNRDLIIASSGVDVDMYIYSGSDYVLYEEENIVVNNMAPNDAIRFKFVIKNAKSVATITDIVFANIYGDIEDLNVAYVAITRARDNVLVCSFASFLRYMPESKRLFGG